MPVIIEPPTGLHYTALGETSVRIEWLPVPNADMYEMRGGGADLIRAIPGDRTFAVIRGLRPSRQAEVQVRAVIMGIRSDWATAEVRPSTPIPPAPRTAGTGVIPVIDADRQSVQMRLPDAQGEIQDIRFLLWWSPSDNTWWGALQVPTNTSRVTSRSLALNTGMLDDIPGVLAGNIVMRSTQTEDTSEPTRTAFKDRTHRIVWEPSG